MASALEHRRLIRFKELLAVVPLSRSTIYARMEAGTFPRGKDLGGGVVAWREQDVIAWLEARPDQGSDDDLGVGEGVSQDETQQKAA